MDYWPRVQTAIYAAVVSRAAIEHEWPECHRKGCQGRHGSPDAAFGMMKAQIAESVHLELAYRTLTQPDVSEDDDDPADRATLTLAVLLGRYASHAPTYVKAAQLIIDAYPAFVDVLAQSEDVTK